ncbi:DMT family transporter [Roseovarius sp. SK2]|jgi:drug/metabolite transporter (DMT)-like permease|uniref:DMT family transporter n=1 Tax=Roseovarius TaxID=74030 RepID=UPI00237A34A2|nr:DMT family transporter [Roseovarius sp. SK2]MDD9728012.1 DMT family transporter [Roseovarius sp. SK2]
MTVQTPMPEDVQNRSIGLAAALGLLVIWSGFIVFSRAGVQTALTPGDITALRFMVTGVLLAPFAWAWWPRHLGPVPIVLIVLCGSGALYAMLVYMGLRYTSAAYAGVFTNGALPFFTVLLVTAFTGTLPNRLQIVSLVIVTVGAVLVAVTGLRSTGEGAALGIVFFLTAAAIQSIYIFGVRRWRLTPRQALVTINIPNALVFLPLWYFFMPSGLAQAETGTILFQAAYQGLGPGLLAMVCFALAANHLGPTHTAGFSAAVPASAALLAIPVLSEIPGPLEWTGIALVTIGLLMLVRARDT